MYCIMVCLCVFVFVIYLFIIITILYVSMMKVHVTKFLLTADI